MNAQYCCYTYSGHFTKRSFVPCADDSLCFAVAFDSLNLCVCAGDLCGACACANAFLFVDSCTYPRLFIQFDRWSQINTYRSDTVVFAFDIVVIKGDQMPISSERVREWAGKIARIYEHYTWTYKRFFFVAIISHKHKHTWNVIAIIKIVMKRRIAKKNRVEWNRRQDIQCAVALNLYKSGLVRQAHIASLL